tara:strand:+ start:139 stop:519 length:381 start_codon:yes stop_codon:yes gene_type:complete
VSEYRQGLAELIGIYEADAGFVGEAAYFWGKIVHGHQCALCDISHHLVRQKGTFKTHLAQSPVPIVMLHLNERPPEIADFTEGHTPCFIARFEGHFEMVLSSKELTDLKGDESKFFNRLTDWLTGT